MGQACSSNRCSDCEGLSIDAGCGSAAGRGEGGLASKPAAPAIPPIGTLTRKPFRLTQALEALEEEREALLGQGVQLDAKFAATRSASAALASARTTAEERARNATMQLEEALSELIPARAELAAMAKRIQVSRNPPWSETHPRLPEGHRLSSCWHVLRWRILI